MESNAIFFPERELLFKERTGKDFNFFYKKYYPKLLYYTSKMAQSAKLDNTTAEDVTTDAFLTAFEKIEKYHKDKSQFSTWLFTIGKNLMLQVIKNEQKTLSLDVPVDEEGTTMKDFLEEEESDQHIHDLTQMKADIMLEKISQLKNPYKQVIEMREIKKMVYKDIASDLGEDVEFNLSSDGGLTELPEEILELSEIYSIVNDNGEEIDFTPVEGDTKKTPFYTQIYFFKKGEFIIKGRKPKSLSTIKSQIRNGRKLLINQTENQFHILDDMYV